MEGGRKGLKAGVSLLGAGRLQGLESPPRRSQDQHRGLTWRKRPYPGFPGRKADTGQ